MAKTPNKEPARPAAAPESASLILVYGGDEYQVSRTAHRLVDQLCPEADRAFGLEVIEGDASAAAETVQAINRTLDAVRTVGFFGGRKVVWLKNATFFAPEHPSVRAEEAKARVQSFTEELKKGLPSGHVLLITAPKVDGRSSFYKLCKERAALHAFEVPEKKNLLEAQSREWALSAFREQRVRISGEVLDAFIEKAGYESRQILQEVEKLALYVRDRAEVTLDDVRLLVAPGREALAWDLTDAVGLRNLPEALRVLQQLFYQDKESTMPVIFGLEGRLRELLLLRACLDQRWVSIEGSERYRQLKWRSDPRIDEILSGYGQKDPRKIHPFRALKLVEQAARFGPAELTRALSDALVTHEQLVSSSLPGQLLLEFLLIRLLGKGTRQRAAS